MLVHICCAVDSHYFLQKLREDYPNERLIGFFYDPNIHPYSEYYLRLLEVKRSCKSLGIKLIEGEYDYQNWLNAVRGLESEPEKGKRCSVCFDRRFLVSAKMASKMNEKSFTSTLLTSPKKSLEQLKREGERLAKEYNLTFIAPDYRKKSGTQEQNILAKEAKLYRQDYCGCIYGLTIQRREQNRLIDELMSPISNQIQPDSIEERIELYEKRIELEERQIEYKIIKERFLNWRLKWGVLLSKGKTIPAHILPYSTLKRNYTRGKVESFIGDIALLNRDEVKFITLKTYNKILNKSYSNTKELIFNPATFKEELLLRSRLLNSNYDLSALLVVDEIPTQKLELKLDAKVFEDTKESLALLTNN